MRVAAQAEPASGERRPSIVGERIRAPKHPVALYSADTWPLAALGVPPSQPPPRLHFATVPDPFRAVAKELLWLVINRPSPERIRHRSGRPTTDYPTASTVAAHLASMRVFFRWLVDDAGCTRLQDVTESLMTKYRIHLSQRVDGRTGGRHTGTYQSDLLNAVTRIHAHAKDLAPEHQLASPQWIDENLASLRRSDAWNKTEQLPEDVHEPLLRWALLFIEDFSQDILNAASRRAELDAAVASSSLRTHRDARDLLTRFVADNGYLPVTSSRGTRAGEFASTYLAAVSGHATPQAFSFVLTKSDWSGVRRLAHTPLDMPIAGKINGRPWIAEFDYYAVEHWKEVLGTACLVTIGLLMGARPDELLSLQVGAVERVDQPNGQMKWVVQGRLRKGQRDLRGRQLLDGVEVVWVTTEEAARAAAILAQLHPDSTWAFPSLSHSKGSVDAPLRPGPAANRLATFVDAVNKLASDHGLGPEASIPAGTSVTTRQFRRTTIALLADQPDGLLAAAHQAKHAIGPVVEVSSLDTTGGYAFSDAVDQLASEHRREVAISATMRVVHEVNAGAGVSGPAAQRVAQLASDSAITHARYLPERQLRSAVRKTGLVVHDNPATLMLCAFNALLAHCEDPDSPNFGACQLSCPNHAMVDSNVPAVAGRVEELRRRAAQDPAVPRAAAKERLADRYARLIQQHEDGATHV